MDEWSDLFAQLIGQARKAQRAGQWGRLKAIAADLAEIAEHLEELSSENAKRPSSAGTDEGQESSH
ncbi:hypothetical protein ACIPY0_00205 [Paenarthrobacter nicotinovorans]|uniref:hypothetical protein n=1 Tax=Paenarthrobacter nicotinovorans TaxID=29320 RepID=UPI0037FB2630